MFKSPIINIIKMPYAIETFDITKKFIQTKGYKELLTHPFRKKEITQVL